MSTFVGDIVTVTPLNGVFEAAWLMERGETYYMIHAANNVGKEYSSARAGTKPTYQRQQLAVASSSPPCIERYWIEAVHDQKIASNPLPPEYWSTYRDDGNMPVQSTVTYSWMAEQELHGVGMSFFADSPAGSVEGVAPPTEWFVETRVQKQQWVLDC
ncbi:hypothetical protein E4U57_008136, partial [Claviceps arundinis]